MNPRQLGSLIDSPRTRLIWSTICTCLAATVTSVCLNWQVARSAHHADITSDHGYRLNAATIETLASLKDAVSIYILVSHTDPLGAAIAPIIDAYSSANERIKIHWIDPERNPARLLALQSELGIVSGASKDGKSLSDSVMVLERGKARNYVTIDDLLPDDPETGEPEPRVEQALTRATRKLLEREHPIVCFIQGHQERVVDDLSPDGLSELKAKLASDSTDVRTLEIENAPDILPSCALLVVPDPELSLSVWALSKISDYRDRIGSLWVMSGAIPDDAGTVHSTGGDGVPKNLGVSLSASVVIDHDSGARPPDGFGESFFALPVDHAITRALGTGNPNRSLRVLVSLVPAISITPGSRAIPLLKSSNQAIAIHDIGSYLKSAPDPRTASANAAEFTLAVAAELGESLSHRKRRIVISPASIALNRALRSPGLVGNRAFVDGTVNWLLARPPGVEISASRKAFPPLEISESDLRRLQRYVLIVMPGAAVLLWLAFMMAARYREGPRQ